MELTVGAVLEGKVKSITNFGAFIALPENKTGMVHISEVATNYVKDIKEHLTEGQDVKVKVIGINEAGKVSLSIKKAEAAQEDGENQEKKPFKKDRRPKPNVYEPKKSIPQSEMTFDDMLAHFKQSSEERISDLKRSTDRKNGTRRK